MAAGTPASCYSTALYVLAATTLVVFVVEKRIGARRRRADTFLLDDGDDGDSSGPTASAGKEAKAIADAVALSKLKWNFLAVYALIMGSDWLQGPYVFSLYNDEYKLPLHTISLLFVLGFLSAGVSAPFVGKWADNFGRKRACLFFTLAYTISCITKMVDSLPSLAFGRVLGGLSTSLLFSVPEAYLVSEAKSYGMTQTALGELLGRCTLVNGVVASLAGVASDYVVNKSGTYRAPFVASGALLVVAGGIIACTWGENYGRKEGEGPCARSPWRTAFRALGQDPALMILGTAITAFETSMYLFVFLWVPTLQDSLTPADEDLPLGAIFSGFMVSMMLGSLLYNGLLGRAASTLATPPPSPNPTSLPLPVTEASAPPSPAPSSISFNPATSLISPPASPTQSSATSIADTGTSDAPQNAPTECDPLLGTSKATSPHQLNPSIRFHLKLLTFVLLAAAVSLVASATSTSARARFFSFLLFEFCVGLYYPTIASLRSALIPEECRATLCALFRVPLNLLVTASLVAGMESHRMAVSVGSCCMLTATAVLVGWGMVRGNSLG